MKKFSFVFLLLLIQFYLCPNIFAQIQVKLQQPPPNQLRAADLWKLTLFNPTSVTYKITLMGTLDEESVGRVGDGTSGVITLPKGQKIITYDDVKKGGKVNFKSGKWEQAFLRTGNAPTGNYTICVYVKDEKGSEIGKDCIQQKVEILSPPMLISPADGETLSDKQPVIFTWTPPTPKPSGEVTYTLKIVEVLGSQSPSEAMKKNSSWFEKDGIKTTTFQYSVIAKKLEVGKKYAWQVSCGDAESEVFVFKIHIEESNVGACLGIDTTQYTITCLGILQDGNYHYQVSNLLLKKENDNTDPFIESGDSDGDPSPQNYIIPIGSFSIINISPQSIIASIGQSFNISFELVSANQLTHFTVNLTAHSYHNSPETNQKIYCDKDFEITFDELPPCSCCENFIHQVNGLTVTESSTNNYSLNGYLTAGPNPICKIKAQIVSFSYSPISIPPTTSCPNCVWPSQKFGNFGQSPTIGSPALPTAKLSTIESYDYSREFIWQGNVPTIISNTPFSVSLLLPDASPFTQCCIDTIRMCIRFSFTDISCVTCDTIISFWFTRSPVSSLHLGYNEIYDGNLNMQNGNKSNNISLNQASVNSNFPSNLFGVFLFMAGVRAIFIKKKKNLINKTQNLFLLILILFSTNFSVAQNLSCDPVCPWSNSLNISTGFNPIANTLINIGEVDPLWHLINVPPVRINLTCSSLPSSIVVPNAYAIGQFGTNANWVNVGSYANRLSSRSAPQFGCDNMYSTQPWRFIRKFCVCGSNDVIVRIQGNFRADDYGSLKLVTSSGTILQSLTSPTGPSGVGCGGCYSDNNFNWTQNLIPGTYFLEFDLANTNSFAMGFALNGEIRALNESQVLINEWPDCCSFNIVSGQKILDNNCNGFVDSEDSPGVGWTFYLSNGSNTFTTDTDNNGEFFFYNVPFGTYTLQENVQSGWIPGTPTNGSQTVTISETNTIVNSGVFLNCPHNVGSCKSCCDQFTTRVQSQVVHLGTNWWGVSANITTAPNPLIEIRADLVNFYMNNQPGCERCVASDYYFGSIAPYSTPQSQVNWNGQLVYPSTTCFFNSWGSDKSPRELVWNNIVGGQYQSRPALSNENLTLRLAFPEQHIFQNTCCFDTIKFCMRWSFTDVNCKTCDTLVCYTIIPQPSQPECKCGRWDRVVITTKGTDETVFCGKPLPLHDQHSGISHIFKPLYNCQGQSSDCNVSYKYTISQGDRIIVNSLSVLDSFTFTPDRRGKFSICIEAYCNGVYCSKCCFELLVGTPID